LILNIEWVAVVVVDDQIGKHGGLTCAQGDIVECDVTVESAFSVVAV